MISFENLPSTNTPLNATNLNKLNDIKVSSAEPITGEKVWLQEGKNLFNKNIGIMRGRFLTTTGEIGSDETLFYQEYYIPVKPSTQYTMSATTGEPYRIVQYNSNKGFISRMTNENSSKNYTFTTDVNCYYIRISSTISNLNSIQIEYGNTASTLESYIDKKILVKNNSSVYETFYDESQIEDKLAKKATIFVSESMDNITKTYNLTARHIYLIITGHCLSDSATMATVFAHSSYGKVNEILSSNNIEYSINNLVLTVKSTAACNITILDVGTY